MKNKFKIATLLFFATSFTLGACSDWTDIEGIDIKQPNIQEQNPELYTKYLEKLTANTKPIRNIKKCTRGLIIAKRILPVMHNI